MLVGMARSGVNLLGLVPGSCSLQRLTGGCPAMAGHWKPPPEVTRHHSSLHKYLHSEGPLNQLLALNWLHYC